jgi:hypothetical protein
MQSLASSSARCIRHKKKPVVPVSYREKIRISRSEINFFLNIFFMVLVVFCWTICSRVMTSILTRDAYFLWTNLGNLVQ